MAGSHTLGLDVANLDPDLCAVDALARLQLEARRHGYELELRGVSPELRKLIELAGLSQALGISPTAQASRTAGTAARCPGRT